MLPRALPVLVIISLVAVSSAAAQQSDNVRKGLAALALYDQTGELERAQEAVHAFGAALKADKNDAWAHYGLGVTLFQARKAMATARAIGIADGEAINVAKRELERALELRPDFTEAAEALALVAERIDDAKSLSRSREVLSKSADRGESVGRLDLLLGDTAAILGRPAVTAGDLLRRAMVLFGKNDNKAGAEAYFAGVDRWDDRNVGNFINDVSILATSTETAALTSGTREERAAALRMFWHKRAVRDGVTIADRIGEHYRRMAIARRDYKRQESRGAPAEGAVITAPLTGLAKEIDDRGIILIKYGQPFDRIRVANALVRGNETWVYLNPDGSYENFRFAQMPSATGYQLVSDPLAMLEIEYDRYDSLKQNCNAACRSSYYTWVILAKTDIYTDAMHFFEELGRFDPRMRLIALRLLELRGAPVTRPDAAEGSGRILADMIRMDNFAWAKQNQARALAALQRDAAPYVFTKPLVVFHDFATFRGRGCTDVVYSIAARSLSYRVNVNLSDTLKWETQSVDTVVAKETGATGFLRSTGVICAQPNPNGYVRFMVSSDSSTGAVAGGAIDIRDYTTAGLLMSDLLFAAPNDGPFVRGSARLALVPPRQFRQNQPFRVFYELYNMPVGRQYKTDITLTTVETNPFVKLLKGKKETTVSFESNVTTAGVMQELRTIVPDLDPGKVTITVRITDRTTGESVSRSESIWILPERNN